jgi:hypothetical protein
MNEFIKDLTSSHNIEVLERCLNISLPDDGSEQGKLYRHRENYEHNMRSGVYNNTCCTTELRNCIVNIHFLIGDDDKLLTNLYFDYVYTPITPLEHININIKKI